uniref:Expressed protein n=1 Tax=Brachypodium sylvaticum TaxID=29664 RepID=A1YKE5_BRASY|nr:expressed protein [Brachypodium sylvaticum]
MGSVSLKLPASRRRQGPRVLSCLCSPAPLNLLMLLSLVSTNLLALLAFFSTPGVPPATQTPSSYNLSAHVAAIAREIGTGASPSPNLPADPPELFLFLTPHALPLGRDARSGLTHMPASVGSVCLRSPSALSLLSQFMSYAPHAACPLNATASTLPRRLVSKGCEPLPRRRCLTRRPPLRPSSITALDPRRWVTPARSSNNRHEFLIDDVIRLAQIRIGLDVSGGGGDFAARMKERNGATVVTTVLEPTTSELVAARGLFPLQLSPAHRLPFYDGVFDLVHAAGTAALDGAGAPAMGLAGTPEALEFFLFDVDRVLRVGGLLWIDSYPCPERRQKAGTCEAHREVRVQEAQVGRRREARRKGVGLPLRRVAEAGEELMTGSLELYGRIGLLLAPLIIKGTNVCTCQLFVVQRILMRGM